MKHSLRVLAVAAAVVPCLPLAAQKIDVAPRLATGRVGGPEVILIDPDPAFVVEDDSGRMFAVNQILLRLEQGHGRARAEQIAGALGGVVVGQVSLINLYQLQVPFTAPGQLFTTMESIRGQDGVAGASHNQMTQLKAGPFCPPDNDSNKRTREREHRCPLQDITFFQTVTILENLREHLHFSPVKVAVIDSGISLTGRIDFASMGSRLTNLLGPQPLRELCYEPKMGSYRNHGTRVCSIIAAPQDDSGICGIASRILGDALSLTVAPAVMIRQNNQQKWVAGVPDSTLIKAVARAHQVEHADIINMSFCGSIDPNDPADVDRARVFRSLVNALRNEILFVVSADADKGGSPPVHDGNSTPCGIDAPNLITVTATSLCKPSEVDHRASSGDARYVQIAAPGFGVPVEDPVMEPFYDDGTSFAAPQVAAVAAVLKSLGPSLSPTELKQKLTDVSHWPSPALTAGDSTGRRIPRLHMYSVLGRFLLENSTSARVRSVLRILEYPQLQQYLSYVTARFCGFVSAEVEGVGGVGASFDEIWRSGAWPGVLDAERVVSFGGFGPPDGFIVGFESQAPLKVGEPMPLWVAVFASGPGECDPMGSSIQAGEMTIDRCFIDQMDDDTGTKPKTVTLVGEFSTTLMFLEDPCGNPAGFVSRQMTGAFELPVVNSYWNDPQDKVLALCDYGRPPGDL